VFAATLSHLILKASKMREENDLTIWGECYGNYYKYRCNVS
jgi:hypothetical protein